MSSNAAAHWILSHYPVAACRDVLPLGNRGGFSGAALWRVETVAGPLCLRAWPENGIAPHSLTHIHHLMTLARGTGRTFVPVIFPACTRQGWVESHGRLWDLTEWLPGQADYHAHPAPERLRAACTALAQLHQAWQDQGATTGSCPALARRLDRWRRWQDLVQTGWRPDFASHVPELREPTGRAWEYLQRHLPALPAQLFGWTAQPVAVQPCLCDLWHDHVLFQGNQVTGMVDYGSVKIDNVAVDLARLLGSLIGDEEDQWRTGLLAYRAVRPLSAVEEDLARLLDRSGTLLALANWLTWLYHERRAYENPTLVAQRLQAILNRVECWSLEFWR